MNVGVRASVLAENEKWLKMPILRPDFSSNKQQ
jgi:hypothetical protein